jgi:beta-lactamase superfamily II metal-dependent hydrolase
MNVLLTLFDHGWRIVLLTATAAIASSSSLAQTVGEGLPPWTPGMMDIHRISTGKGDAVLYVFPDRTTLLTDPGAAPVKGPKYPEPRPDASRKPGEWIVRYITHFLPDIGETGLDYALITHFHGDHMGAFVPDAVTVEGGYQLTGITEVGHRIPIRTMVDRGWPDYDYPPGMQEAQNEPQRLMFDNYRKFLAWQTANRSMQVERFRAGRNDQIVLKREPAKYPTFKVQNISASGEIWTGEGSAARPLFPAMGKVMAALAPSVENMCSLVFRLEYGKFRYYAGGDIPGVVGEARPDWHDIETPVAKVVGPVDVSVLNHHGVRDTGNPLFISTQQPRVIVVSYWSSTHLDAEVLKRWLSSESYAGPRDVFSTNIVAAHAATNPDMAKLKSQQGHIVVRVAEGGGSYQVIILDDASEDRRIKAVHGPYSSR